MSNPAAFLERVARVAFWLAAVAVLYFALAPVRDADPLTGWDKANHLLAFATLAICGLLGWNRRGRTVLAGLLLYGVAIELLQLATPDHRFDLRDVAADAAGLVLGWCAFHAGAFTARVRAASARARRLR